MFDAELFGSRRLSDLVPVLVLLFPAGNTVYEDEALNRTCCGLDEPLACPGYGWLPVGADPKRNVVKNLESG